MNKIISIVLSLFKKKTTDVISEKILIREKIRHKKQQISDKEKASDSNAVFEKIEALPEFKEANTILIYWSMNDELPTHNFIIKWSKMKQMLLPVVKENDMLIMPFSAKENMKKGSYGIWEPETQREYINKIDLVIVPGIAFDKKKSRLGRGKGYYDRYFMNKRIKKIGIGFDFQLLDKVPTASFDIKMDKIITPSYIVE